MDFFHQTGKLAIGSRLRMLTDKITADAAAIYKMFGIDLKPKWFPVFFLLSRGEPKTITAIARKIGHSHPSVSRMIQEMVAKGLVRETRDANDGRRNIVQLTAQGQKISESFTAQCVDVTAAIERITRQTQNDLWLAIEEWENLLKDKSLLQRVKDERKIRERQNIRIVPYEPCYQPAFKTLTEAWITSHWHMEETDLHTVNSPQKYILDKGGHIFIALDGDAPVGVCALCKMHGSDYDYELAKLAVSTKAQGKGIGELLCETVIAKARELGAQKLFLESNTILEPAIHLYRKLGFREISTNHLSYARGNIQMEKALGQQNRNTPATHNPADTHRPDNAIDKTS